MSGIIENIIAGVILALITPFVSFVYYLACIYPRRRALWHFFNLSKNNKMLVAYLSSLIVQRGHAKNYRGEVRSYEGITIPGEEFQIIQWVNDLFSYPEDRLVPRPVLAWLERIGWYVAPILVYSQSPLQEKEVEESEARTMICVGSEGYNAATAYFTGKAVTWLNLSADSPDPRTWSVRVLKGRRKGETISVFELREGLRPVEMDLAILERINDRERGVIAFLAHGWGVNGTRGAVRYLVEHWQELHAKHGTGEFALCLQFPTVAEDPQGYLAKPRILLELPE